ncbi:MAG: hypothetical protein ACTSRZ_10750 [Promethearchaeota archaeon]
MNERKKTEIWPLSFEALINDLKNAPNCLKYCIDTYFQQGNDLFNLIQQHLKKLKLKKVLFIGNTFNYFASFVPIYTLMNHSNKVKFWFHNFELTEFYDYILPQFLDQNTLYIFISKSGTSRLIVKSIEHLRMLKTDPSQIWLVTNNDETPIKKHCSMIFPINVVVELILGTRSFFNTTFVLWLIAMLLLGENPFTESTYDKLMSIVEEMKKFDVNAFKASEQIMQFFGIDFHFIYFLAKGASLSAAHQAALAAKTYGKIYANSLSIGLFYHGPFQIADDNFRGIFFIGDDFNSSSIEIIPQLIDITTKKLASGKILLISNNEKISKKVEDNPNVFLIKYQCKIPWLSPIIQFYISTCIFVQFAMKKGLIMFL